MREDGAKREPPAASADGLLWQRSRVVELVENDAERFLDLAGFADGLLDPDDRERVAEWLAADPAAAGDVAAAGALAAAAEAAAVAEAIVARACALVPPTGEIIPFRVRLRSALGVRGMTGWGSLAAAVAVAGWLGFTLGMDTSRSVVQLGQAGEDGFLQEMLNPSNGFLRELTEEIQT
jgi:anti-sigma factor RsiW